MKLQNKFLKTFLCSQNVSFSFSWVCKIPILNVAVAIEAMVSVKKFLRNFPITFSKRSVFTFIVIKPITKFGFRFPNVGNFTTNFTFQQIKNFFGITCKGTTTNFKIFVAGFRCKGLSSIKSQIKQVFSPHGLYLSLSSRIDVVFSLSHTAIFLTFKRPILRGLMIFL